MGVIGLGNMGRTHLEAYRDAAASGCANRVVAVCNRSGALPAASTGNLEPGTELAQLLDLGTVAHYSDADRMLAEAGLDLVSICTPTDTHVELASRALRSGVHVLLEKPVALTSAEVARLREVARTSGRLCMPAMCMRFWPGWRWLKDAVDSAEYGPVQSAEFRRLGAAPDWSRAFYGDTTRSGGALFDLHVHDADFVLWLFGRPESVTSSGGVNHVTTHYHHASGPQHVLAEASWEQASELDFHMSYRVVFEHAIADFRFQREPSLLLERDGATTAIELPDGTGYPAEVRHLLQAIASGSAHLDATLEDALRVTELLEAERASLAAGQVTRLAPR